MLFRSYESNTLTAELSRSFIFTKKTKRDSSHRWIINTILLRSNTDQYHLGSWNSHLENIHLDNLRIFILTRNYLHNKIYITLQALRAIAQLVEHLVYTRADVFQGSPSWNQKKLILLTNRCLTP